VDDVAELVGEDGVEPEQRQRPAARHPERHVDDAREQHGQQDRVEAEHDQHPDP
jgi:hypothetical protein